MKNIIYVGTNTFAAYILEKMIKNRIKINYVITKKDSKSGRGRKNNCSAVKNIATKYNIAFTTKSINTHIKQIKLLNPDLIIIIEYTEKVKKDILEIPSYGVINIHPSILPKLRGPTPIQYAIINNFNETGVSIIKINEKIDAGDIISVLKCKISKNETYLTLSKKLQKMSFKLLKSTLNDIKKNNLKKIKQNESIASYTKKLDKNFYKINWNDEANFINRKIRATFNIAKHHTFIQNNYINILETSVIKKYLKKLIEPGIIINRSKYGIDVSTGNGILRIKKIQFPGKKINTIKDILNSKSYLFKIGYKFE